MLKYFEELKQHYRPDKWNYTTVISALLRHGRKDEAMSYLSELRDGGIKSDYFLEKVLSQVRHNTPEGSGLPRIETK